VERVSQARSMHVAVICLFFLLGCLVFSLILKMEAVLSFGISGFFWITWHHSQKLAISLKIQVTWDPLPYAEVILCKCCKSISLRQMSSFVMQDANWVSSTLCSQMLEFIHMLQSVPWLFMNYLTMNGIRSLISNV
jgi:hypothetical protein